jgi:hypothetical protein
LLVGCISQFVLKVETCLRVAGIEFQTRSLGIAFAETAPKGRLPYIEHDGAQIAGSSISRPAHTRRCAGQVEHRGVVRGRV